MSKKKPSVASLLTLIKKAGVAPETLPRFKELDALEHGMVFVLTEFLTARQAEASVRALRGAWGDWNEVRVSQIQDLVGSIKSKSQDTSRQAARRVLDYLQDVFQNHHSFDLLDYDYDLATLGKHLTEFPVLGKPGAHYVQWVVGEEVMPVTGHLVRVFDRLGMMDRTTSYKKGLEQLSKLGAPKGKRALDFALSFGYVAGVWCDSRKPTCHACALVDVCPYGKKAFKDWQAQQERLEVQRQRDEERERKRLEVEAKKAEREAAKATKAREREMKRAKAKQAAADKKKAADAAAKEAAKKEAAAKKAAARKEAAAKKAAARKEAAAKKAAAKKAAAAKKKAAKKKAVKKAPAKKVVKKAAKKATKKKVTKKAPAKKAAKKKATKKVVKKATKKKATKKVAKKKATKKAGKRR